MDAFKNYLISWELAPDGEPFVTLTSQLLPVRYNGTPAMLKIALSDEERNGGGLMVWWHGQGAAKILAHNGDALLMERAMGKESLVTMAKQQDDEASRILCRVASQLHTPRNKPLPPTLVPLNHWFKGLDKAAIQYGGLFKQAAETAQHLLKSPQDIVVLHGDIHYGNILDFDVQGWLAIDPKGLIGERGFDFANIFCNPDREIATKPGRLEQQVTLVSEIAGLDRSRLMQWIFAYAGLSAAWHLEDGSDPQLAIDIAKIVSAILAK